MVTKKNDDSISFSLNKTKLILTIIASLIAIVGTAWSYGGSYHEQFATTADLYTLAIQDKEDSLSLIEFKESVGSATAEDGARKSTIVRRLADLKKKLEKAE